MKLAVCQAEPTKGDIAGAFARLDRALTGAAAQGASMLVMPELFLPGYNRPDLHAALSQPMGGPWMSDAQDLVRRTGCALAYGWAERDGDRVFNAASVLGPDGAVLAHYRKIQLFGPMEAASFRRGDTGYVTFDVGGRRFGLLICYDVEFPGHVAALRELGVGCLLVPTANPVGFEHVQRILIPARAYEGRMVIAYANYTGTEAGLAFGGQSIVAGPDARPMAQADASGAALLIVDLAQADALPRDMLSTQDRDFIPG